MNTIATETGFVAAPKIVVLGATGPTGRHIVSQAVGRGYDVTVLVRSPEKAQDLKGAKLVVGDARDEKALRQAVKGQDIVISALGTPASPLRDVTLLSIATQALANAMKAEKVSRLIAITGMGAGDSAGHGGFLFDKLIFPCFCARFMPTRTARKPSSRAATSIGQSFVPRSSTTSLHATRSGRSPI